MIKIRKTVEYKMYFNAPEYIFRLAKDLRANQTDSEKELWKIIGSKKILGLHFRRQHPVNIYIVDFYCHEIKLAIEVDGEIHSKKEKHENDLNRTAELERLGIKVIRFTNKDIFGDFEWVKMQIVKFCEELVEEVD